MKLFVLTTIALLGAGAAQAQSMSGARANPSAPADGMTAPSSATSPADAMASDPMTEKMARAKLSGAGYGTVTSIKRTSNGEWEAVTKKGSKQQHVTIAADGTVSPDAPM